MKHEKEEDNDDCDNDDDKDEDEDEDDETKPITCELSKYAIHSLASVHCPFCSIRRRLLDHRTLCL